MNPEDDIIYILTAFILSWNSSLYGSTPIFVYNTVVATSDFRTDPAPWTYNISGLESFKRNANNLERLDNLACIERYIQPFSSPRDVIVVTNTTRKSALFDTNSSLIVAFHNPASGERWFAGPKWICSGLYFDVNDSAHDCNLDFMKPHAQDWRIHTDEIPLPVQVDYCLSAGVAATRTCQVRYSLTLFLLICCLNLCKCICIIYTRVSHTEKRLVTIGDAIASFLQVPDETTAGHCLANMETMTRLMFHGIESADNKGKIQRIKISAQRNVYLATGYLMFKKKGPEDRIWPSAPNIREHVKDSRLFVAVSRRRWLWTVGS